MAFRHTVAVDLDGVLAKYDGWKGVEHIGDPILGAVDFCNKLAEKYNVVVHTSRCNPVAGDRNGGPEEAARLKQLVVDWLDRHGFKYNDVYTGVGKIIASAYVDDRAVPCRPLDTSIPNLQEDTVASKSYSLASEYVDYLCNYTTTKEKDKD